MKVSKIGILLNLTQANYLNLLIFFSQMILIQNSVITELYKFNINSIIKSKYKPNNENTKSDDNSLSTSKNKKTRRYSSKPNHKDVKSYFSKNNVYNDVYLKNENNKEKPSSNGLNLEDILITETGRNYLKTTTSNVTEETSNRGGVVFKKGFSPTNVSVSSSKMSRISNKNYKSFLDRNIKIKQAENNKINHTVFKIAISDTNKKHKRVDNTCQTEVSDSDNRIILTSEHK